MRRILLGVVLLLHALAHANAGMLADGFRIAPTVVWAITRLIVRTRGNGTPNIALRAATAPV